MIVLSSVSSENVQGFASVCIMDSAGLLGKLGVSSRTEAVMLRIAA